MSFAGSGGVAYSSKRMDWETPTALFDQLDAEFHFTLDAAASHDNHKCSRYFTAEDDGLAQSWAGETVFCNPPYGRELTRWVEKAWREAQAPATTIVLLIPARTDTKWFHSYIHRRAEIRFLKGRIRFEVGGVACDSAPFPSMVVVMGGAV